MPYGDVHVHVHVHVHEQGWFKSAFTAVVKPVPDVLLYGYRMVFRTMRGDD